MIAAAGIVLWRRRPDGPELLLAHLGGPFFARKDAHAWTVPKGLLEPGEDALAAACREWREETGTEPPAGPYHALAPIKQAGGKLNHLFAVEGDADAAALVSGTFELEWPPRSGRRLEFAEVDRFGWFGVGEAREKLTRGLVGVVDAVAGLAARD